MTQPTLYRFYDPAGRLLYVGIMRIPYRRFLEHEAGKPWWRDVARIELKSYPDLQSVIHAEKVAIIEERPLHNVTHNKGTAPAPIAPAQKVLPQANQWTVQLRAGGNPQRTPLTLAYEIQGTPISDDWDPEEMPAEDLFWRWRRRYPAATVPIAWFVTGELLFEWAPLVKNEDGEDFLSFYRWPTNAATGDRLSWLSLPVDDGHWTVDRFSKGGFFQEFTGWKPAALQPTVNVDLLLMQAGITRGDR